VDGRAKPGHDGGKSSFKESQKMKLTFSPASPFARKVRIAAIELGLIDRIEFVPETVAPGQPNEQYAQM
jgi:glutathione S-transferase